MTDFKRVLRNSVYLLGFRLLSRLLSFVFLIYAASRLSPESFGALSFTLVTLELVVILGDLGITRYGARELVRSWDDRKTLAGKILSVQVVTSLAITIVGLLVVLAFNPPAVKLQLLILALASFFFYSFINTTESIFVASQKFFFSALFSFVGRIFYTSFGLVVLASGGSTVLVMWGFLASVILEALLRMVMVRSRITGFSVRFPTRELWAMLRVCFPFAVAGIASVVTYRGNMFVLEFLKGDTDVGVFNAAFVLFSPFVWIGIIFSSTIFPGLTADFIKDPEAARASCWQWYRLIALLSVPVAVEVSFLAGTLRNFFPAGYEDVELILIILMWSVPPTLMMDVDFNILQASNREAVAARSVVVGAVGSPLFSLLLIPFFGGKGAAAGVLVATVVREVYCRFALKQSFFNQRVLRLFVRPAIAAGAMGAVGLIALKVSPWLAVGLGAIVYAIVAMAVGAVRPAEFKALLNSSRVKVSTPPASGKQKD